MSITLPCCLAAFEASVSARSKIPTWLGTHQNSTNFPKSFKLYNLWWIFLARGCSALKFVRVASWLIEPEKNYEFSWIQTREYNGDSKRDSEYFCRKDGCYAWKWNCFRRKLRITCRSNSINGLGSVCESLNMVIIVIRDDKRKHSIYHSRWSFIFRPFI